MKLPCKLLFLSLFTLVTSVLHGQLNTGNITGFGWGQGTYRIGTTVPINLLSITGPMDVLYYDITVRGFDIYGDEVGDGFNGAGDFGYIIDSGYTQSLAGPAPMTQPETGTMGPWFWTIPNEGRLHSPAPAGYFLNFNFYSENPAIDPNAILLRPMGVDGVFVDVEADLYVTGLDFPAGNYVGGDFITLKVSLSNGFPPPSLIQGMADPFPNVLRETRPLFTSFDIDFRLSIDPAYDTEVRINSGVDNSDDFDLHTVTVVGDGKNGQSFRDSWLDPAEVVTITTDALLPKNYSGIFFLGTEIDSGDSPGVRDLTEANNILMSSATARIHIRPTNSPSTHPVSERTDGNGQQVASANEYSDEPSVSGDGARIAFVSRASNLLTTGSDNNNLADVFIRNRDTGTIQLASMSSSGVQANRDSSDPDISVDGRFVTFSSLASNLVDGDVGGFSDIFLHDIISGETTRITKRIETPTGSDITYTLEANGSSFTPSISEDGRFIAFQSYATNLDHDFDGKFPKGGSQVSYIYVHDRGVDGDLNRFDRVDNVRTYLVSTSTNGSIADSNSYAPDISFDAKWIGFGSIAQNLQHSLDEPSKFQQIYRRRLFDDFALKSNTGLPKGVYGKSPSDAEIRDSLELLSLSASGDPGNSDSYDASVNGDGSEIAFVSEADNLDFRMVDSNGVPDIFVRSIRDGEQPQTVRVSISSGGNEAIDVELEDSLNAINVAAGNLDPTIDRSGRFIAFRSHADNITHLSPLKNGFSDVFLHDRDFDGNDIFDEVALSGVKTEVISVNRFGLETRGLLNRPSSASSRNPSISADSRFVAFSTDSENTGGLRFSRSNMYPLDSNFYRDIFLYDQNINVPTTIPELYPPSVVITEPNNGDTFFTGTTIFVNAFASDPLGTSAATAGITKVDFFVNGEIVAVDDAEPYSTTYTFDTPGTYNIRARATDLDGYETTSASIIVTADISTITLPEIELLSPRDGLDISEGSPIFLKAKMIGAIDPSWAVSVIFKMDGQTIGTGVQDPNDPSIFDLPGGYSLAPPGSHIFNAEVTYTLPAIGPGGPGMVGSMVSSGVSVIVMPSNGLNPPQIQWLFPPSGMTLTSASKIRLLTNASDPDGDLESVQFYINNITYGNKVLRVPSISPEKYPFGVEWSPGSPGVYTLQAIAWDNVRNASVSPMVQVVVTSGVDPPVVEMIAPFTPPEFAVQINTAGQLESIETIPFREGSGFDPNGEIEVFITGLRHHAIAEVDSFQNGEIRGINLIDGGNGYTRTPKVNIVGSGKGALAFARVHNQKVSEFLVRDAGYGFSQEEGGAKVIIEGGHSNPLATATLDKNGGIAEVNIATKGSGFLDGAITTYSVINPGIEYPLDPSLITVLIEGVGTNKAEAEVEVNYNGSITEITPVKYGAGYDKPYPYPDDSASLSFSLNGNYINSSNASDPKWLQFITEIAEKNTLNNALLYDTLVVNGAQGNDSKYTILSVSAAGIEVYPNLETEGLFTNVDIVAYPAPPVIEIVDSTGHGTGARVVAFVASPSVVVRDVRAFNLSQASGVVNFGERIKIFAEGSDVGQDGSPGSRGKIIRTEYYIDGQMIFQPTAGANAILSNIATNANGDIFPLSGSGGISTDNQNAPIYWSPNINDEGIHEMFALTYDDDHNVTTSSPVLISIVPPSGTGTGNGTGTGSGSSGDVIPKLWITSPIQGATFNFLSDLTPGGAGSIDGDTNITTEPIAIEVRAEPGDSEGNGSIAQVRLFANSTIVGADGSFPYQFTFTPNSLGQIKFIAEATDVYGNTALSDSRTITVTDGIYPNGYEGFQGALPVVEITSPLDTMEFVMGTTGRAVTLSAKAAPNPQTPSMLITQVEFFVNDDFVGADNAFPYRVPFVFPGEGHYEIRAVARDSRMMRNSDIITVRVIENPLLTATAGLQPWEVGSTGSPTSDANRDFIVSVYRDLTIENPDANSLSTFQSKLDKGYMTREDFVAEVLDKQRSLAVQYSSATQYLLTGIWPDRDGVVFNTFLYGQRSVDGLTQEATLIPDSIPVAPPNQQGGNNNNNNNNNGLGQGNGPPEWRLSSPGLRFTDPSESPTGGIVAGPPAAGFIGPTGLARTWGVVVPVTGRVGMPRPGLDTVTRYYYFLENQLSIFTYNYWDFDLVASDMFRRKYFGVAPDGPQVFRIQSLMETPYLKQKGKDDYDSLGQLYLNEGLSDRVRIDAVQALVADNEIATYRDLTYTKTLEITFPPNNTMADTMKVHALWVSMARNNPNPDEMSSLLRMGSIKEQIQYILSLSEYRARFPGKVLSDAYFNHWASGAKDSGGDWYSLKKFGFFLARQLTTGWIYHQGETPASDGLGWIFIPYEQPASSIWLHRPDLGWCWTTISGESPVFPYLYSQNYGWLYFEETEAGSPWFYSFGSEAWMQLP
ncbi:MAG: hypothetical protein HOL08_04885 [Opitutae bacterium]|nr:hypothetical protein [Opitutae bacterium]